MNLELQILYRVVRHLHLLNPSVFNVPILLSFKFLSLGFWCHTDSIDVDSDVQVRRPGFSIFLN